MAAAMVMAATAATAGRLAFGGRGSFDRVWMMGWGIGVCGVNE